MGIFNGTADQIANTDEVKKKITKLSVSGPPFSQAVIINPGCTGDGDTDYDAKYIDDNNWSQENGFANAKNYIATRNDNGNLTTDTPTTDTECANKKYVDTKTESIANKVDKLTNDNSTYMALYAESTRTEDAEGNKQSQTVLVGLVDGPYANTIPIRTSNGGILVNDGYASGLCATVEYVNTLKTEISELRAMVEELKG